MFEGQEVMTKPLTLADAVARVLKYNLIQTADDGDFVLVAEKSSDKQALVKKASIKQGQNYGGNVEVLSGLKKGDLIITTGFQDVNSGETVAF
jgi:multidrug efflux pump subunit AcrA (membrane-fusion protein)